MKQTVLFICVALALNVSTAKKLPPEYQTCKRDDPSFSDCLRNAIQDAMPRLGNGIPSLNIPSLQPMVVPSITIGEGKGAVNVVQNYKNYNLYNLGTGNITKFNAKLTPTDLKLELEIKYSELRVEAEYSFDGKILALPLVGNGNCVIKILNPVATAELHFETFEKKGEKYLKVKNVKLRIVPGKMVLHFENLFNGDARLGDAMNNLLNENWEGLFEDVEEPLIQATTTLVVDYSNKIFSKVTYDELF